MDGVVTFTTVALLGAVIYTAVNFIKYLKAGIAGDRAGWNGVVTLLLAAVVGIAIACWAANSDVTENYVLIEGADPLGKLDFGSLSLLGVALASTFSVVKDFISSWDNTDSAAKPTLVGPPNVSE